MQVTRCLHTAILVSDLAKAEKFYSEILGLSKAENRPLKFPGTWYQIGEYQLHLIVHPEFTNPVLNREKWGRNPHLAIAVDNLAQAIARLEMNGYPLQMSASGRAAIFTQDPDRNIIEISEALVDG
jgi:catechol 2,3-dioxygenase-like lactoylglutathione lyase family enzyme